MKKQIVVFAGNECSSEKENYYYRIAYETGYQLAKAGFSVVTGGGPGLMREVTRGAWQAGGTTIGICLSGFGRKHSEFLTEKIHYQRLNSRQEKLLSLGQGFIALPGGIGTFYEICAVLALKRRREISSSIPLIIVDQYFQEMEKLIVQMKKEGFVKENFSELYTLIKTPFQAVEVLRQMKI